MALVYKEKLGFVLIVIIIKNRIAIVIGGNII
jgi:hypothetical protein